MRLEDWEAAAARRAAPAGARRTRGSDTRRTPTSPPTPARTRSGSRCRGAASSRRAATFDAAALARYGRFVDRLLARGLEPVVTLHHYTHPAWFHDETPWTSPASVEAFARFARRVAAALAPRVRIWVTSERAARPPPRRLPRRPDPARPRGRPRRRARPRPPPRRARGGGGRAAGGRPGAAVGVAHNMMDFAPERPGDPLDRASSARTRAASTTTAFLEAFATGRWNLWIPPFTRFHGRRDVAAGLPRLRGRQLLLAPSRAMSRHRPASSRGFSYRDPHGRGLTDNGWEIVPGVLRAASRRGRLRSASRSSSRRTASRTATTPAAARS